MPALKHPEPEFFAPLAELEGEDVDVYLGIIHHTDGVEGFRRAHEHGAAVPQPLRHRLGAAATAASIPAELPHILAVHRDCAAALRW